MGISTFRLSVLGFAGALAASVLAIPVANAADDGAKRDEDGVDVVLVSDDDDNDDDDADTANAATNSDGTAGTDGSVTTTGNNTGNTNTGTNTGATDTGTGTRSGDQDDPTNSRVTAVSEDRDDSIGDVSRDVTQDGPGGATLDQSENFTNDQSLNDTRG